MGWVKIMITIVIFFQTSFLVKKNGEKYTTEKEELTQERKKTVSTIEGQGYSKVRSACRI